MIAPLNCVFHISSPTQAPGSQELFKGQHRCSPAHSPASFPPSFPSPTLSARNAIQDLGMLCYSFSSYCDTVQNENNSRKEAAFICLRVWQQELGQWVTWQPQSGRRAMRAGAQFSFPFYSVWDPARRSMSSTCKSATPYWQHRSLLPRWF